jgi:hypothetical protein
MVRRVIRKLKIIEVSGVDRPANAHARAAIIKRHDGAHIGDSKLDYSKVDFGALADIVLEGAATALRKREPHLSPEQAYAKVYTSPDYRLVAESEREASAKRLLAGVPVARTAAHVLNSLDDDAINELTIQIKQAHPFLDDAGIVRLLIQRVEAGGVGKALSDDDLQAMVEYERKINPTLSDQTVYRRVAASRAVRVDRREFHGEMEAARDDAMSALDAKADELRAANPELTKERAFAAAYSAPENRELMKAERRANRPEG